MRMAIATFLRVGVSVFFFVISWTASCFAQKYTEQQLVQLERQIIDARQRLVSGRVEATIRYTSHAADPSYVTMVRHCRYVFDGSKRRADQSLGVDRSNSQKIVDTDKYLIRLVPGTEYVQLASRGGPVDVARTECPDPRRFGVVPWFVDSINTHGFESLLLRPDRRLLSHRVVTTDNGQVLEAKWQILDQSLEYALALSQGNQLVRLQVSGGDVVQSIACKLTEVPVGTDAIWYPSEVVFRHEAGNAVTEELLHIDAAEFNVQVDDDVFWLSGLDIEPGTPVAKDEKTFLWDGKDLTPATVHPFGQEPDRGGLARTMLAVICVVCLVVGVAWLVRNRKRS